MAFTLRDYEIVDTIGTGAYGTVYRARQKSLGRIVAIKALAPQRAQDTTEIMRFRREARATAALAHDNIIAIYDYAFHAGSYYIVMEYVEGRTLEDAVDTGISAGAAVEIVRRIADGLACAHRHAIIHRDIKPSNVLLGVNGRVKLADFGLAAFQQALTSQSTRAAVGTVSYMAPEIMVDPAAVDVRADIFSLGCVLYQALSGRLPFPGTSIAEVSYRVINEEAPALESVDDASLSAITLRCLDKDRDRRPTAEELARELAGIVRDGYPAAAEEVARLSRGEESRRMTTRPSAPLPPKRYIPAKPSRSELSLVAGAILALGIVAAVMVVRRNAPRDDALLPEVLSGTGTLAIEPARNPRTEADEAAGVHHDAPGPLTSLSDDEGTATLILTGLRPGDSIVINGRTAYVAPKAGSMGLPLAAGENRLEVRGAARRRLSRSFEASALQVITWNLNGRDEDDE
jgi:serine/threonine-protein kinase